MAAVADLAVYDPVRFRRGGSWVAGHIARKTAKQALVVASDGREYRVPWVRLARERAAQRKRVTPRSDRLKAQFRPDDRVEFAHRSAVLRGVVARLGPKRAYVVTDDKREFYVPYAQIQPCDPGGRPDDERRLAEVELEAERLLALHGLKGWSFQYDDASNRAGMCSHPLKLIGLARLYCLHATDAQVRDTILHEIAHALAGPEHNHDRVWKDVAQSIGCIATRCHSVDFAPPRYIVSCPNCHWAIRRNVRRHRTICKSCRSAVEYEVYTGKAWELAQARQQRLAQS